MPKLKTSISTPRYMATLKPPFFTSTTGSAILKTLQLPADEAIEVHFPFGPKDIDIQNIEIGTSEIQRPNQKPILAVTSPKLKTVTFSALIADKASGGISPRGVYDTMQKLEEIASNGYICKFVYGLTSLNFAVVVTRLSFTILQVNGDGEPIRVQAQIQFTESPYFQQEIIWLDVIYYTPDIEPVVRTEPPPPESEYDLFAEYQSGGEIVLYRALLVDGTADEAQRLLDDAGLGTTVT